MQRKDEFIKDDKIIDIDDIEKDEELIRNIKESKSNLGNMYKNLQFAEGDLIDYFTYQIKAEESKYDFLIKQAKNNNIDQKNKK